MDYITLWGWYLSARQVVCLHKWAHHSQVWERLPKDKKNSKASSQYVLMDFDYCRKCGHKERHGVGKAPVKFFDRLKNKVGL